MNFEISTGRELDALVAERVFGYLIESRSNTRTGATDFVYAVSPGQWVRVPNYGSSMSSSIQLEVELQQRGWTRKASPSDPPWDGASDVRVVLEHKDGRRIEASGLPSEALCRVALHAVQAA